MDGKSRFSGFPEGTLGFLADLARHNDREWFKRNRSRYDDFLVGPAREFVAALGGRLESIAPGLVADPRINRSLFRLNRDTRFSADKTPYKTHLGLWLWEGERPRMENSGFYVQIEPAGVFLGAGLYLFPEPVLRAYREAVVDPKRGAALGRAIGRVAAAGEYSIGGQHYQRVPRGFDPTHPRAELLKHIGLYAGMEGPVPAEIHSERFVAWCLLRFKAMLPIHRWVRDLIEGVGV